MPEISWGEIQKYKLTQGFRFKNPGRTGPPAARLPFDFGRRGVKWRVPYTQSAELIIDVSDGEPVKGRLFPESAFTINIDKPFEIHRLIVRVTAIRDDDTIFEIQPDTLLDRVRLRIIDLAKGETLTKGRHVQNTSGDIPATSFTSNPSASALIASDTGFWQWEEPYTLVRSEGFQIQVDVDSLPSWCVVNNHCSSGKAQLTKLGVKVSMQGFLIVVAPPSETR
jgi:hypothetical protein